MLEFYLLLPARPVPHHFFLLKAQIRVSTGQGQLHVSPLWWQSDTSDSVICCLFHASWPQSWRVDVGVVSTTGCVGFFCLHFCFLIRNCAAHCTSIEVFSYLPLSRLNSQFTAICYVYAFSLIFLGGYIQLLASPPLVFQ